MHTWMMNIFINKILVVHLSSYGFVLEVRLGDYQLGPSGISDIDRSSVFI